MTEFAIYGGVDHRNTVGKVAAGLFAQEGRCWRMIYENPVGHGTHCMKPVEWVGRWTSRAALHGEAGAKSKAGEQVNRRARSGVDGLRGCLDQRGTQLERDCEH